jgi:hypothetical protein
MTGYSNATASGSCSANSIGSVLAGEDLEMVLVTDLLARVDVNPNGHA